MYERSTTTTNDVNPRAHGHFRTHGNVERKVGEVYCFKYLDMNILLPFLIIELAAAVHFHAHI